MTFLSNIHAHYEIVAAKFETVYTQNNRYQMPDVEIKKDDSSYVYVPLRGTSATLAVFDINDKLIGWINTETLGYPDAKSWIAGEKWIDQGL